MWNRKEIEGMIDTLQGMGFICAEHALGVEEHSFGSPFYIEMTEQGYFYLVIANLLQELLELRRLCHK